MLVSAGSSHNPAKPRITSGVAKPVSFTARPKRVSSGRLLWTFIAATKANGPATQIARTSRSLNCAPSFEASAHAAAKTRDAITAAHSSDRSSRQFLTASLESPTPAGDSLRPALSRVGREPQEERFE